MTLLFAGKKAKPQQGGARPKAYPLMQLAQTAKQRKSEKGKRVGKGEK